jgi:hypothetical protein
MAKEPGQIARDAYVNSMLRHAIVNDPNPQDPLEPWAAVEAACRASALEDDSLLRRYMLHVYEEEGSTFASHYRDLDPETFTPEEIALLVQLSDKVTEEVDARRRPPWTDGGMALG